MTIESSKRELLAEVTIDPASIAAGATGDETATVRFATVGQRVSITPTALEAGLVIGGAWVSDVDEITIRLANVTASPINAASQTFLVSLTY